MVAVHRFPRTRRQGEYRFPPPPRTDGIVCLRSQLYAATPPHLPYPPAGEYILGPPSCATSQPAQTPDTVEPSPCYARPSSRLAPHPPSPKVGEIPYIPPSASGLLAGSRLYRHRPLPIQTACSTPSGYACPPYPPPAPDPCSSHARYEQLS